MRWHWSGARNAAASALTLTWLGTAGLTGEAGANEAVPPAVTSAEHNSATRMDPMSELAGTPKSWSVSRTDAGCYLLSPRRTGSSSLAIGRHPKWGLGLFVVNFALSVPKENNGEPVVILTEGHGLDGMGRVVGTQLLFIPLDNAKLERGLQTLKDDGTLWLMLRHTWIAHGGQGVAEAVLKYRQDCGGRVSG
jgi:hypothetical protein